MTTNKRNEWIRLTALYTSEAWKNNFATFSAELPPLPDLGLSDVKYHLERIDDTKRFEKGNVKWVASRKRGYDASKRPSRARVSLQTAEGILKSFYFKGESRASLAREHPQLTEKDMYDLLQGYRYKVEGFDYVAAKMGGMQPLRRTPQSVKADILELFEARHTVQDISEKTKLPVKRVLKILARM